MLKKIEEKTSMEIICEQIQSCFINFVGMTACEAYHLLEIEIKHLDLLLDVLLMRINIKEYLECYYSLFSTKEEYEFTCNHIPQLSTLEKEYERKINVSSKALFFIEILRICSDNMKKHIEHRNYELIKDEIYYNHNVPSLISANKKDLVKYYLDIECKEFKNKCMKEIVQPYEAIWLKIDECHGDGGNGTFL